MDVSSDVSCFGGSHASVNQLKPRANKLAVPESDGSCNFTLQLGRSDQSETYHMAAEGNFVDGNQQLVKAYRFQGHFSLLAVDTFNVTGQIHAGTSLCRWDMVRFQDSQGAHDCVGLGGVLLLLMRRPCNPTRHGV